MAISDGGFKVPVSLCSAWWCAAASVALLVASAIDAGMSAEMRWSCILHDVVQLIVRWCTHTTVRCSQIWKMFAMLDMK